ncbi:MAG: hypothetical protein J0I79_05085 [Mesorhizobium sp.]|uniref:hypothetical protein n=1 Tax=Mesorhizobium sp. TaxID=1871066 RepID=UPI001AC09DD2|nr:hypothetical protein [Mesorhizobium sp.]MBN9217306.1 hypothetical protein [Mesorhizobium sp.]
MPPTRLKPGKNAVYARKDKPLASSHCPGTSGPRDVMTASRDAMIIASMVSVGLGAAFVSRSVRCIRLPNVVYRPCRMWLQRPNSPWRSGGDASSVVNNFIALARRLSRSTV